MYNYNHLYYFYITAKSGGVTAAAQHLKISQPSLSSQLKVLEGSLDLKLFRKVGRSNQLTEAGSVVYGYCRRMFELSEELAESILEQSPATTRRIHIGVSEEVDRSFVTDVLSLFLRKHGLAQRPRVAMVSDGHDALVEKLRFRELDVVLSQLTMTDPELKNLASAEIPVALVCSHQHKLRNSPPGKTLQELLKGEPAEWLMPSAKFKLRAETDRFFESHQIKGRVVFESDVMKSLVRSVADEIGLAFLPLLYVGREIREKSVRPLGPKQGYWKYRLWLGCHNQNQDDVLIQSLGRCFAEVCA